MDNSGTIGTESHFFHNMQKQTGSGKKSWKRVVSIYGIDEKKVTSTIREDNVDIMVELTGHTANNKMGTMACQPAPVQVTGLATIHNRVTAAMADPPNTEQK